MLPAVQVCVRGQGQGCDAIKAKYVCELVLPDVCTSLLTSGIQSSAGAGSLHIQSNGGGGRGGGAHAPQSGLTQHTSPCTLAFGKGVHIKATNPCLVGHPE